MKNVLVAAGLLSAMVPAHAISRYESRSLTCGEAQAIVASEGAAILRYQSERNPSLTLYDRYVRNRAFCQPTEVTKYDWIPTADTRSCPVLTCEQRNFENRYLFQFN
jgi:hypothetical protein